MADLTLIKKLRETTGCGISDCSKALAECKDNIEEAIDWLRKKGLSAAGKKSGRVASEGVVAVCVDGTKGAVVEVNSETDFVARTEKFQKFVKNIADLALQNQGSLENLKAATYPGGSVAVEEELKNQIGVIGENINIRRSDFLSVDQGVVVSYIHNAIIDGLGKIAVLVALESDGESEKLTEFGKQIAMHVAASRPEALNIETVDSANLDREVAILKEQAKNSGKPDNIIEKMLQGRIRKYYEEVVLVEQSFVMDDKIKIKDLVANFAKESGSSVQIKGFKIFVLGEGVEKKENNFAEEVASMTK